MLAYQMVELDNHMTTGESKKNIMSLWRGAGIQVAMKLGCDMSEHEIAAGYSRIEKENDIDSDDECEMSRGTFEAIQEMPDEFDDEKDRN